VVTVVPALVVGVLAVAEGLWRARKHGAALRSDLSGLLRPILPWPGVRSASAAVGLALLLLIADQLVFSSASGQGGERLAALLRTAAAVACAGALLVHVGRAWSPRLAYLAVGLLTLAACTLATAFVPDQPRGGPRPHPVTLNALVVALGLMTWFWSWLAQVWQQQLDAGSPEGQEPAWTTAGRLVPINRRASLVTGVAGLVVAGLMAAWPLLPVVSGDDDSWGRMLAGVAAHLLLLLALIGSARWSRRAAFHLVGLLVLLSSILFVAVRLHAVIERFNPVHHAAMVEFLQASPAAFSTETAAALGR
jgi:hypothetical protein